MFTKIIITNLFFGVAIFLVLVVLKGDEFLDEMRRRRATRRLAELTDVQKHIREVESGLPLLATNARGASHAEDYGSDPWRVRTNNQSAEVKSNQALLRDLKAREKELIRLLNKEG